MDKIDMLMEAGIEPTASGKLQAAVSSQGSVLAERESNKATLYGNCSLYQSLLRAPQGAGQD